MTNTNATDLRKITNKANKRLDTVYQQKHLGYVETLIQKKIKKYARKGWSSFVFTIKRNFSQYEVVRLLESKGYAVTDKGKRVLKISW